LSSVGWYQSKVVQRTKANHNTVNDSPRYAARKGKSLFFINFTKNPAKWPESQE
jgi:hypothetical protein